MALVVHATWTAQPGAEDAVRDALAQLSPASRREPGNQFYQAYQDPTAPEVFRIFEIYDDEEAFVAHGASDHFRRYALELAIPLLASRERAFFQTLF